MLTSTKIANQAKLHRLIFHTLLHLLQLHMIDCFNSAWGTQSPPSSCYVYLQRQYWVLAWAVSLEQREASPALRPSLPCSFGPLLLNQVRSVLRPLSFGLPSQAILAHLIYRTKLIPLVALVFPAINSRAFPILIVPHAL